MRLLTERAALRKDALTLLSELGGTAGEVAVSLYAMGVRVRSTSADDSSAARYLHAVVGADTRVKRVRITKRWLVLKTHRRWRSTIWLRLPAAVREFTVAVDRVRPNRRRTSHTTATEPKGDPRSSSWIGNDIPIWPRIGRF